MQAKDLFSKATGVVHEREIDLLLEFACEYTVYIAVNGDTLNKIYTIYKLYKYHSKQAVRLNHNLSRQDSINIMNTIISP